MGVIKGREKRTKNRPVRQAAQDFLD